MISRTFLLAGSLRTAQDQGQTATDNRFEGSEPVEERNPATTDQLLCRAAALTLWPDPVKDPTGTLPSNSATAGSLPSKQLWMGMMFRHVSALLWGGGSSMDGGWVLFYCCLMIWSGIFQSMATALLLKCNVLSPLQLFCDYLPLWCPYI